MHPDVKQQATPFSPPSGPPQRLFQGPPAKSKFLAAFCSAIHATEGTHTNPLFPALRSGPTAVSGASRQKQIPSSLLLRDPRH